MISQNCSETTEQLQVYDGNSYSYFIDFGN